MTPATDRLLATVGRLTAADLAAPSLLPGWSRAHVVAHLTLNAEGLAGAVRGVTTDRRVPMYASSAARDDDIDVLAASDPAALAPRLREACAALASALHDLPPERAATTVERTPGSGPSYTAGDVPLLRLREVEIHHVDLDAGYAPADWPVDFTEALLESESRRPMATGFTIHAVDLDRSWPVGAAAASGPVVSGAAADLGWWLTGRGTGDTLTSDRGDLPPVETW